MENNNNGFDKAYMMKILKVAIFCGLGFWAAGSLGAVVGLILAIAKTKD